MNSLRSIALTFMTATLITSQASAQASGNDDQTLSYPPKPPAVRVEPHVTEIHGEQMVDNYFWLRDKKNPEVAKYLEDENAYTDAMMAPTKPLQERLYTELVGHIKETDTSAPYREGDYWYYTRTEQGKQYQIYCRKKADGAEEIVLDVNELAKDQKFMAVAHYVPSDDGNWLAYSTDNTGFRQYHLHVKDLRTGKTSTEDIPRTTSVAWANDNKTLLYTTEDKTTKRSNKLFRHTVGEDVAKDATVYEETDEQF